MSLNENSCALDGCPSAKKGECCENRECRYWINYPEDLNCTFVAIEKNGPMTLAEVAKRLGVSLVRISQIEKKTVGKLYKRIKR